MLENDIKKFLVELKTVKKQVSKINTGDGQVNSKPLREKIETLAKLWFNKLKKELNNYSCFQGNYVSIEKRDKAFTHLLQISSSHGNKKKHYLIDLNIVISKFQQEIISHLQTGESDITPMKEVFDDLLAQMSNNEQNEYLSEALNCARNGYLKAAL